MGEIDKIIAERNLKASDCGYHTRRVFDGGGKVRVLNIKGEEKVYIEYVCPHCGHEDMNIEQWRIISKSAKIRFSTKCKECGKLIKIEKLKGKHKRF